MRYNTSLNELEIYSELEWRSVRYKEPNNDPGIVQQNVGTGDASERYFGPLNSQDPNTDYTAPAFPQNIIVIVGNVIQISSTNYSLVQSVSGNLSGDNAPYADGYYLDFGASPLGVPDLGEPVTVLHNFDK